MQARKTRKRPSETGDWFECTRLPTGATYLRWSGLFEFLIARNGRRIEYRRMRRATAESLTTYLLGQVLSFSLLSFGCESLHSTAIVIDGEAVGFLGNCGYGKSTLGAGFLARGFPILTDDVLAVEPSDGRWIAHAGPARLKLFPTVARQVLDRRSGPRLNPDTAKLVLPLNEGESTARALPLTALYVLNDPAEEPPAIDITPLGGQQAFIEIIQAAFNLLQIDRARLENHFGMATQLVRDVPLRRLTYPRKFASLDAVCGAVLDDAYEIRKARSTRPVADSPPSRPIRRSRPTHARRAAGRRAVRRPLA